MKIDIKVTKEFDIKYIFIDSSVRYWEDSRINGIRDISNPTIDNPPTIPKVIWDIENQEFKWVPIIDIDKGIILDWPTDIEAIIHYKVCDEFKCCVKESLDKNYSVLHYEGYVPRFMCPVEDGFGDYIIMSIDKNGKIKGWNPGLVKDFLETL